MRNVEIRCICIAGHCDNHLTEACCGRSMETRPGATLAVVAAAADGPRHTPTAAKAPCQRQPTPTPANNKHTPLNLQDLRLSHPEPLRTDQGGGGGGENGGDDAPPPPPPPPPPPAPPPHPHTPNAALTPGLVTRKGGHESRYEVAFEL